MTEAEELELLELEAEEAEAIQRAQQAQPPVGTEQKALSGLQGFGQAATFGYLPQLQAATAYATRPLAQAVLGQEIPKESYSELLKQFQAEDIRKQQQAPVAYGAGQVGGVLSTVPLVSAQAAKLGLAGATTAAGKAAQAAGTGALVGGLQKAEGEFGTREELLNRLRAAGVGLVLGGAAQAAGGAISQIPKTLEKAQTYTALKAAGATTAQLREMLKKKITKPVADFMSKQGLLKVGSSVDDIFEKSSQLADETGQKIGEIYDDIVMKGMKAAKAPETVQAYEISRQALRPSVLADEIMTTAQQELKGVSGGKQALTALQSEMDNILSMGDDAGFEGLLKYRMSLDDTLQWNKTFSESKVSQQALKKVRSFIDNKLNNHIVDLEKTIGSKSKGAVEKLKELKDTYSKALKVKDISQSAVAREMAKMPIGLPEIGIGMGYGTITQDPLKGLAAAGLTRGARYLGAPAAYKTLGLAKTLTAPLGAAQPLAPTTYGQLGAVPWTLMRGNNGNQ